MPKPRRSNDWGFPRWRGYESERAAANVKLCDRHGCEEVGDCPAPKAPNSRDRWYFCQRHAAEYNQKWDYFEGLDKAEKALKAAAKRVKVCKRKRDDLEIEEMEKKLEATRAKKARAEEKVAKAMEAAAAAAAAAGAVEAQLAALRAEMVALGP